MSGPVGSEREQLRLRNGLFFLAELGSLLLQDRLLRDPSVLIHGEDAL